MRLLAALAATALVGLAPAARAEDLPKPKGTIGVMITVEDGKIVVVDTVADSPAAKAGLKAGDVIVKINGNLVRNAGDLQRRLMDVSGETTITIIRDHKEQTLTVKLEEDDLLRARGRR